MNEKGGAIEVAHARELLSEALHQYNSSVIIFRMSAKESCASSGGTKEDDDIKAAELRDEILFKQPESSHLGDCPLCCLPLSLDAHQNNTSSCCGKRTCNGCLYANQKRQFEQRLERIYVHSVVIHHQNPMRKLTLII